MLFFFIFSYLFASELTYLDIKSSETLLIFIYYERPGLSCPLCNILSEHFDKITNIEKRKINFYDNPFLASKFLTIFFPALFVLDHKRAHYLDYLILDDVQKIINEKSWSHKECNKWRNNPNSVFVLFYSYLTFLTFCFMKTCFKYGTKIPTWIISIMLGVMAACLVIIVAQLIRNEVKQKRE
ncbi:hypothetical protein BDAP_002057 [Binucleata daphniae]